MVKPCALSVPMVLPICWMMTGARPSVGSSSSNSRAPVRRMRAIASICCSPPESLVPWLRKRSLRLGNKPKIASRASPPGLICGGSKRFSSTSRLAKMPRSSGQNAIPERAIWSEVRPMSSRSSNRTEPWRWPTMPMMDFSVVVLPAPLRPSSVTTSPGSTANVAPCRMWDSPYQACNASTASSGAAVLASSMADPHVGLADLRVGRDRLVIAFGEDAAAGQHGDAVGQIGDDAEIVLDHQHRAIGRDRSDQRGDAIDVLVPHAGGRLVEQQHLRVEHALRAPEIERSAAFSLQRDAHVLEHGQLRKHRRDLERAHEPEPRHVGGSKPGDVVALVDDAAVGGAQKFGQQIEASGLAGAIRADQRVDRPALDTQVDVTDRDEAREFLGEALGLEDDVVGHRTRQFRCGPPLSQALWQRSRGGTPSRGRYMTSGGRAYCRVWYGPEAKFLVAP